MNDDHPNNTINFKSTAGGGLKFDLNNPLYGYEDLKGHKTMPTSGQTAPVRAEFKTGCFAPGYSAADVVDWEYHREHVDMAGSDNWIHIHLKLGAGTVASGANLILTCVIGVFYHNRNGSPSPITKTFTVTPAQLNAFANGSIIPAEILFAQAGGNDTTEFNSSNWLIDDDIIVSTTFTQVPTLTGGTTQLIGFGHCDIHRRVAFGGTIDRVAPFYGTT